MRRNETLQLTLIHLCLGVAVLWAVFPVLLMIGGSLKPAEQIWAYPPVLFAGPTLDSYANIGKLHPSYWGSLINSIVVTTLATLITMMLALGAAFVFSRVRHPAAGASMLLMVAVRMVPPIIIVIPVFPIFSDWGWIDTINPLVLSAVAFSVSIAALLLKTFIDDVPVEIEEAAMIDGCSWFGAFWRITVPCVMPAIAAVALLVAISTWNEYMFPLIFTSNNGRTAPVIIAIAMDNEGGVQWGVVMALATIHLCPPLLAVLVMHRQLINVVSQGAVKG